MKIADTIPTESKSLTERGLHDKSFFHVIFSDDSEANEANYNWRDFSELKRVKYMEGTKSVMVSNHKIKYIKICHNNREVALDIPEGHEVYQAVRSETSFVPDQAKQTRILGRAVGLVKDGEIIQEIFINGLQDVVLGWKK